MTVLDLIIIGFCLLFAAIGFQQGLVVGVLSLVGFAVGAFLGTRLAELILNDGSDSAYAPLGALMGALLVGGLFATTLESVGAVLRERFGALTTVDGAFGSVLFVALALGLAWIGAAVVGQAQGTSIQLRRDIQRSEILRRLTDLLPPSGPLLRALARFDPFPQIAGPPARGVAPPASGTGRDPDIRAAAGSIVRVTGTACGLGVEGTGWVARRGKVVTNAHVVLGQDDTKVQVRGEGTRLDATVVALDVTNDIAVLRVPALDATPALPLAPTAPLGRPVAVVGFPRNGPYNVRSARIAQTATVQAEDAYGRGPVTRRIVTLRARVRPGNSGGPALDKRGRVAATIFAASQGKGTRTGYAIPNSIVRANLSRARGPVSTGACAG